jgi:hypothetical protein
MDQDREGEAPMCAPPLHHSTMGKSWQKLKENEGGKQKKKNHHTIERCEVIFPGFKGKRKSTNNCNV